MSENSISISVAVDRRAALLAGRVLGERANITVSPEIIGEHWPRLVQHLDLSSDPVRLRDITVRDPSPAEIITALVAEQAAEQERIEKEQGKLAEYARSLDAMEAAMVSPLVPRQMYAHGDGLSQCGHIAGPHPLAFSGWTRVLPSASTCWGLSPRHDAAKAALDNRRDEIVARNQSEIDAANAVAHAAALPGLLEINARLDAEAEAKKLADEAAKKEANKVKFAARLESGYWERETGSYNERRYSAPWCASVTFSGTKPIYDFGESTGKWGKAGLLRVQCKPGDFIAWGQKDLRRPGNSDHNIMRMRADGSMESFGNATEAYRSHRETSK